MGVSALGCELYAPNHVLSPRLKSWEIFKRFKMLIFQLLCQVYVLSCTVLQHLVYLSTRYMILF